VEKFFGMFGRLSLLAAFFLVNVLEAARTGSFSKTAQIVIVTEDPSVIVGMEGFDIPLTLAMKASVWRECHQYIPVSIKRALILENQGKDEALRDCVDLKLSSVFTSEASDDVRLQHLRSIGVKHLVANSSMQQIMNGEGIGRSLVVAHKIMNDNAIYLMSLGIEKLRAQGYVFSKSF
jgi:hypothetical protein